MERINADHPYFNDFVKIYNQSVEHDNKTGKLDSAHAHKLAKDYAEKHVCEWHRELFLRDWETFYYHMFD